MGVSGSQVAASVLASTSAAVVASFFGVAGTIIGAAVVSVVATVGTAAYGLGIRRTTDRLQRLQTERITRIGRPGDVTGTQVRTATRAEPATAVRAAHQGGGDARPDAAPAALWGRLARHRWSLAGGVALVLALSLGAVSLIEVATDGPLAGGDSGGRTSIGAVLGRGDSKSDDEGGSTGSTTTTATDEGAPAPAAEPGAGASTTTTEGASPSGAGGTSTTTSTTAPSTTTVPPTTTSTVDPTPEPPPPTVPPASPASP
jgi:hypothetical protein